MYRHRWIASFAIVVLVSGADAAVVCKKKNGVLVVRETACKAKETVIDLAGFGAVGPKGDRGDPGPLVTTLPSGATLRGSFGMGWTASAVDNATQTSISFQFPLEANPTLHVVQFQGIVPNGCTGSVTDPGADPGHLCIFVAYQENCGDFAAYAAGTNGDGRFGYVVFAKSLAAGKFEGSGTWAVTAP